VHEVGLLVQPSLQVVGLHLPVVASNRQPWPSMTPHVSLPDITEGVGKDIEARVC
jgi:hypothetical protein